MEGAAGGEGDEGVEGEAGEGCGEEFWGAGLAPLGPGAEDEFAGLAVERRFTEFSAGKFGEPIGVAGVLVFQPGGGFVAGLAEGDHVLEDGLIDEGAEEDAAFVFNDRGEAGFGFEFVAMGYLDYFR